MLQIVGYSSLLALFFSLISVFSVIVICCQAWEYGLPLCEQLAEVYKKKILYEKLGGILVSDGNTQCLRERAHLSSLITELNFNSFWPQHN